MLPCYIGNCYLGNVILLLWKIGTHVVHQHYLALGVYEVGSEEGVEHTRSSFRIKEEEVTIKVVKLNNYTRIWLMWWSNKIDIIIRKFGLRRNKKYFTKLKIKGLRQVIYLKTYLEEMLDVMPHQQSVLGE
jgi:hypothetical protein